MGSSRTVAVCSLLTWRIKHPSGESQDKNQRGFVVRNADSEGRAAFVSLSNLVFGTKHWEICCLRANCCLCFLGKGQKWIKESVGQFCVSLESSVGWPGQGEDSLYVGGSETVISTTFPVSMKLPILFRGPRATGIITH